MGKPLISLGSLTYAMKGKEILLKAGIKAYVERTPKPERSVGCGYSLYVPSQLDKAKKILLDNGIKIIENYKLEGD